MIDMVEGLKTDEIKNFMDLTIKANNLQIKAMLTMLQGELKKRELTGGKVEGLK